MKYGLLGYPLGHSLSPEIHRMLFSLAGKTDYQYELYARKTPEDFSDVFALDGFNVTIPHKTNIIAYLAQTDEKVRLYHACNTVVRHGNSLHGYNTDVDGFWESLRSHHINLKGKKVLVTGFGGVSKMMVTESVLAGADVTVCLRNAEKAADTRREIKEKTGKTVAVITEPEEDYEIVLQGTPAGMYPNITSSPIPLFSLRHTSFAFDTIYNPVSTLLTNAVNFSGGTGVNGLQMLVCQAGYAQKYFYGADFSAEQFQAVENAVKKQLKPFSFPKNIILIGPPGSGKSSLMEGMGKLFHLPAVDLDAEIERKTGMEIKQIFSIKGESCFRQMEAETALDLCAQTGKVISTGGGIVETASCMQRLFENPDNILVSLMPSKEILLSRLAGDTKRPLLAGNMEAKLAELLQRRMPLYQKYAHIPVSISEELPVRDRVLKICDEIIAYEKKKE